MFPIGSIEKCQRCSSQNLEGIKEGLSAKIVCKDCGFELDFVGGKFGNVTVDVSIYCTKEVLKSKKE